MILKPEGLICTRYAVQQLAAQHVDITEIDLSEAQVIGWSTMHQLIGSFPSATFTGLEGWNQQQYIDVLKALEEMDS